MKKGILIFLAVILLVQLPNLAIADGCFIRPIHDERDISEPSQKAAIFFDGKTEKLAIEATYSGEINEFAWVIPVPSYPNVEKSDAKLFSELSRLTYPEYIYGPGPFFFGTMSGNMMVLDNSGVNVLEQEQIGIYSVTTLSSTNPKALEEWLVTNDYSLPDGAELVLEHYINKGWYFVAMRINLAPNNENLLLSLKEINGSIKSLDEATGILSQEIIGYIKSKEDYNNIPGLSTTVLDYGDEDDYENEADYYEYYRYQGIAGYSPRPKYLLTEIQYNELYENYNGYLDSHLKSLISHTINDDINQEIKVPNARECERGYRDLINLNLCYVWSVKKEDPEYKLLKEVACGQYCDLLSPSKDAYSIEDIAKVGAYAAINGDKEVQSYFGISVVKRTWYENKQDSMERARNTIVNYMGSANSSTYKRWSALQNEQESKTLAKYSGIIGVAPTSISNVVILYVKNTIDELRVNVPYGSSMAGKYGLMDEKEYYEYKHLMDGNHDETNLTNGVTQAVSYVVNWKEESVAKDLSKGTVQPVMIEFESSQIVYPMRMSSLNKGKSEILLYVLTDHKAEAEGFKLEYSEWLNKSITEKYSEVDSFVGSQNIYITKLRRNMGPEEMVDDLIITQASNDKEYRLKLLDDSYFIGWLGFIISMGINWGFLFGVTLLLMRLNNSIIRNAESVWHLSIKRSALYAAVIPALIILLGIFPDLAKIISDILEHLIEAFGFIYKVFNAVGMPKILNWLLCFMLVVGFIFVTIHAIGSLIVFICRRIREN